MNEKTNRSEQSDSDIECVSEVASEDDEAHDGTGSDNVSDHDVDCKPSPSNITGA